MGDSMKKKVIGIFLSLTLLFTILPVSGIIEYDTNYWNNVKDNNHILSTNKIKDIKNIYGQLDRNNSPPYQPTNPNPENGSTNVSLDMDVNWTGGDPDGNNVTYDVYFGTDSTPPKVSANQSDTTYDPGTLDEITTYYWQIIAWDDQGAFNESSLWEFSTLELPNNPPYQPSNPNPENGAINVSLDADLSWSGGDPDGDPVTYDVYFGTDSTPPKVSDNQSDTTYDPGILDKNITYYWHIIAWDDQNASSEGDIWNFTTIINQPPYQPSNPSPSNGSTGVGVNVDLSWEGGDPDNDTVTYDVYFGTTSPPPKIVSNQTETTYDLPTLENQKTYYWQVVAWDEFGAYNSGPIWQFSTAMNSGPYPPEIIIGPSVGGPKIDLEFSAITSDPEGDQVYYMWDWGDGNFSEWLGPFGISTPVKTSYVWNNTGEYIIRVKAKDVKDKESGWSEEHNISISKQIKINNLRPGFVYFHIFTFTNSYLFLQAFEYLGISAVLSTGRLLVVNATVTEHVDSVKFETFQILWNITNEEYDDDMSDDAAVIFSIAAGLYEVRANAYDEDGNLIDIDTVPYLIYICRSQIGGGQVARTFANRLKR